MGTINSQNDGGAALSTDEFVTIKTLCLQIAKILELKKFKVSYESKLLVIKI